MLKQLLSFPTRHFETYTNSVYHIILLS